ncbi:DUF4258 domain-containing protein [Allomuricauda sp. SCSIO 65647]|uniref:DUF4258 domain-containing protein n=1 Tax=Allomuricauda sp. SCSIO 65647 TaxID=2908843 RepID=UPI001F348349|nr:DUF4258 domain-containing protein [Muricauda sp. SCSIO 65647]UJH67221.1 DUF4258 domain-containing protein [Muricauda sp. SCSIO 65647]
MAFLKRLGWYLVGLSIGMVFLVFFLKKKTQETGLDFCYLPNCRVLKDLRSKTFTLSEEVESQLLANELDSVALQSFLKDGDIDFKRSDTRSSPCKIYYIAKEVNDTPYTLVVESCEETAMAQGLKKE